MVDPTFHDDFKVLNSAVWNRQFYTGWFSNTDPSASSKTLAGNHEAECYTDESVTVDADGLVLTASKGLPNILGYPWVSGMVAQDMDYAQTYGYFEIVAKLPKGKGFWPAFWFLSTDISVWPPELDVIELLGHEPTNMYCSAHSKDKTYVDNMHVVPIADASLDYHAYGVLWTADFVAWFYDDKEVARQPTPPDMHGPMYMILNLAVGGAGSWPGEPDASSTSAVMRVRSASSWAIGSWSGSLIPTVADPVLPPVQPPVQPPIQPPVQPSPEVAPAMYSLTAAQTDMLASNFTAWMKGQLALLSRPELFVNLSEDAYEGDAWVSVALDGDQVGNWFAVTALHGKGDPQKVSLGVIDNTVKHTVTVTFSNDAWGGTPQTDRNLYIESYTLGSGLPVALNGSQMVNGTYSFDVPSS